MLALALLAVDGCGSWQSSAGVRIEAQQFTQAYGELESKADVAAIMELFKREPDVTFVVDGELTRGWDAIHTSTDELVGKEGRYKVDYGSIDVTPLGNSHALVVAPYTKTAVADSIAIKMHGALTLVLEKKDGRWRIIHQHESSQATD